MEVYTTKIECGKTTGERSIRWESGVPYGWDGTLEIHDPKQVRVYRVGEFVPDREYDGRAFMVAKQDESDVYNVFVARNGQDHSCTCAAGTFGRVRRCCHVAALLAVIRNGWLEDLADYPVSPWPYPEQLDEPPPF